MFRSVWGCGDTFLLVYHLNIHEVNLGYHCVVTCVLQLWYYTHRQLASKSKTRAVRAVCFIKKSPTFCPKSSVFHQKKALPILLQKSASFCQKGQYSHYGVATIIRLLKMTGLFCRILSLLQGSFAKETYNFKEHTNRSHPIVQRIE